MMNIQNPSFPQHSYGYGNAMAQPSTPQFSGDLSQNQFQQPAGGFPGNIQRPPQYQQGQIPPHVYQQLQQQQQAGFARPQSRGNPGLGQGQSQRQSPVTPQTPNQGLNSGNPSSTPTSQPSSQAIVQQNMAQNMGMQQGQGQNATPAPRAQPAQSQTPMNPETLAREEQRVTTLLEINSHLLQEVTNLQGQGKAGSAGGQQSPTSPTSATDLTNSSNPGEAPKRQPPSPEYAECMRRLQANLAYLAAIADANKKASAARPVGPAIMIPPPHMSSMDELYKKLKSLFPEASQSKLNKAMAYANAQVSGGSGQSPNNASTQGQIQGQG